MQEASAQAYQGQHSPPHAMCRLTGRQDIFSFCVGCIGRKQPTHSAPHGIGGAAPHQTGIIIVSITIIVDISETRRPSRSLQKMPLLLFYEPTSVLPFFWAIWVSILLLAFLQPLSSFISNSIRSMYCAKTAAFTGSTSPQ